MLKKNVIDVNAKLKQREILTHLKSIDWSNSSNSPYIVEFDPTTKCNLACPDCISGELLNQDEFNNDRVMELTQEMIDAGVKGVILIGGGEPMAHPKIGEVINLLGINNIAIGITTNGLYLKKHIESITKYVSWIRVSMDSSSSEMFQSIRPSRTGDSMFDLVIENMKAFSENKSIDQILGYSFMVYSKGDYGFKGVKLANEKAVIKIRNAKDLFTTNANEIYNAAVLAKEIGCNYLEVKPMYDSNHFSVLTNHIIADIVEEQLEKAKLIEDENFRIIEATKLRSSLRGGSNYEKKEYTRCAVSQLRTLVTPSGVYVCPYFRGVEQKKIGDVNTESFIDMWHGSKRKQVMNNLNPSIDCPMHCIRNDSNIFIESQIINKFQIDEIDTAENYDKFI